VAWNTVSPYQGQRKDFRQESIYFCITTRFYNADTTNDMHDWDENKATPANDPAWRGDFKGLIQKMDYIKALGFTSIWITPVVENCSGLDYHGYHAFNFNKVDPRYESTDVSFQDVIKEAHSRDMKIVLDVVWNHNGNFGENYLLQEFTKNYDNLLGGKSTCENTMIPGSNLPASYPTDVAYAQYQDRLDLMKGIKRTADGKSAQQDPNYYWHHYGEFGWEKYNEQLAQIAGDCVDLNTENPVVAEYLLRAYGQFIHMGVDAFRVDTMKQINRYTLNQYYIGAFKKYAEKCGNPNFFMFGEVCARCSDAWNHGVPAVSAPFYTWKETQTYDWGDAWTNVISSVQAAKDESLDSYGGNVPANTLIAKQPTSTNAFLNGVTYHAPDYSKASGTSVIDFPMHWSFGSAASAFSMGKNEDKYYNDSTWNVVYVNSHDYSPDSNYIPTFSDSTWCEDFDLMFTFRGIPCMYYGTEVKFQAGKVIDNGGNEALVNEGRAYYGDNLEGTVTASGFGTYTASGTVATTLSSTIAQHLMKLNKIRQAIPALQMGQYTTTGVSGNMAYIRRYTSGSTDSLACVAISGAASFSNLPAGTYVDVVSGKSQVVGTAGTLSVSGLSTAHMAVYVLQNASTGTLGQIGGATTYLA
jgi:glycosidase